MTPCVSRIPISDELQPQGDAESERVNNHREICEIKRGAAALNMHHIHFFPQHVGLKVFVVKTATACRANIFPPKHDGRTVSNMQTCGV